MKINLDDKCFPFISGKGIINMTSIKKNEDTIEKSNSGSKKKMKFLMKIIIMWMIMKNHAQMMIYIYLNLKQKNIL